MVTTCAGIKLKQTNIEQIINIIFQMFFLLDSVLCRKYFRFKLGDKKFYIAMQTSKISLSFVFSKFHCLLNPNLLLQCQQRLVEPPTAFP